MTRRLFTAACIAAPLASWADGPSPPALMHANTYKDDLAGDVDDFWVSEKLDGVRAFWNGTQLLTRAGHPIHAPRWFVERLPRTELDGELWGGRGTFERTSGIVRANTPDNASWRSLSYMVFDLPTELGSFDERLGKLRSIVARVGAQWFRQVEQSRVDSAEELLAHLRNIEALGGEGLMLHRGRSAYAVGRSDNLLKYKSFADAEARVVGYVPGNGKYAGKLGALWVEREDGARFKVGSGFTDEERASPPPVGSWITYAYNGETNSGLPRFPRFLRVRSEVRDGRPVLKSLE